MKTKGRLGSINIEDRRPGKIKPWYQGLPLADTFREQFEYLMPHVNEKKRGRKIRISSKKKLYSDTGGGYR
jgi:hypothetical protein